MMFDLLRQFRQQLYLMLGLSKAALFDLMDAILTTRSTASLVQLSLSPLFRRQWSSLYKALEHFRLSANQLMVFLLMFVPLSSEQPLLLALDHTDCPRSYSPTLRERTFEHHATAIAGNKPISLGQGYSTLAVIPEMIGSWALPLRHDRISSFETPLQRGLFQLKQVCRRFTQRPVLLADSEYATAGFIRQCAELACDKLMRLRPNRVLWGAPPPYSGRGRRRKHGRRFALKESDSWGLPDQEYYGVDDKQARVHIRIWHHFHFQQASEHELSVVQVQMLGRRDAKPVWLLWQGESQPPLDCLWRWYQRRFAIDHWNRFAKQRLFWTLAQLGSVGQSERWSRLMVIVTWQLWLARNEAQQYRLPWQKPQLLPAPGRVAQSMAAVLARIGTPAPEPKARGKGTGWPQGKQRQKKPRYPVVKKRASKPPAA